jgi:hypothetical protein
MIHGQQDIKKHRKSDFMEFRREHRAAVKVQYKCSYDVPCRQKYTFTLFFYPRRLMGLDVERHALAALPPEKRPGTLCARR